MALHKALSSQKQPGVSDAVLLPAGSTSSGSKDANAVSEDTFINNLKTRFENDVMYTYIGDVVVSVNPFKQLQGMFGPEAIKLYRGRYYYEVPPHIFAMTDDAYRDMLTKNRDQCVIISGESGAGKTEASKLIMQYIASVSSSSKDVDRVKDILLKSNPILEAFGNAKTNRNNNSSRFGKYMDIQFNFKGDPVGGHISNYLLEKSRVVQQAKGERSFHIIYYLIASKQDQLLKLGNSVEAFAYLKKSECTKVNGIDDRKEFEVMNAAMKTVGFSQDEITMIYKIVSGILHLGNVEFRGNDQQECSVSSSSQQSIQMAAQMFQVDQKMLEEAMVSRSVVTQKESVKTRQTVEQATYARDALSKALYFRLFDYIVSRINDKIKCMESQTKVIGVLDIYGFEVFQTGNGFEQFCINYCNEKLQQLFISLTLKQEQEEYAREGIEWTHIEYFNNQIILDLIENGKNGIIATLDEECLRPGQTSDKTFLDKLNQRHKPQQPTSSNINLAKSNPSLNKSNPSLNSKSQLNLSSENNFSAYFESKETARSDKTLSMEQFRLKHYAGDVTYDIHGFMDKNMDNLSRDIKSILYSSKSNIISSVFPDGAPSQESTKRMVTTATTFKVSLNELVNTLLTKTPHYVRCIKSNSQQAPGVFDVDLCRHQTRYLGLLENVRVRRAGFVFRQPYEKFLDRYRVLCPAVWPNYRGPSKVFIRKPNTLFQLEEERERALPYCATLIQKIYRGYVQRQKFRKIVAIRRIVTAIKKYKSKKFFLALQKSFAGVKTRPDFGKSIPFPQTDVASLQTGARLLKQIFTQWRAEQLILSQSPADRDKIRLKCVAHTLLSRKQSFQLNRPFMAEYLNKAPSQYTQKYEQWKSTHSNERIIFSDIVQKSSRSGKGQVRLLIVTNEHVYLLHPQDFKSSKKQPRSLLDFTGAIVTSGKDNLLILKSSTADADFILDLNPGSLASGEKCSELLAILYLYFKSKGRQFQVEIKNDLIDAKTAAGQFKVAVKKGSAQANGNALFNKSGKQISVIYAEI